MFVRRQPIRLLDELRRRFSRNTSAACWVRKDGAFDSYLPLYTGFESDPFTGILKQSDDANEHSTAQQRS